MKYLIRAIAIFALLMPLACGDDDAGAAGDRAADAAVPIVDTDSAVAGDVEVPVALDAMVPRLPQGPIAAWIEVTIDPRHALYGLGDELTASAAANDMFGEAIADAEFTWSVAPPGIADIDAAGRVTTVGEGQGAVLACIDELCGRATFFVDAAPPTLTVDTPERGAMLGGDAVGGIEVTGQAEDSSGRVEVWVNGVRAVLEEDGTFAIVVPARFGINRVSVVADDGVRRPAIEDVRYVLWAPRYLAVGDDSALVEGAMVVRVDQAMLDGDEATAVPDEAAEVTMGDLAELLRFFVQLADVRGLLGDPVLVDNARLQLRFEGIEVAAPEVDLAFAPGGIDLFLRLPEVVVETSGYISLEGQRVSLDGTLTASVAAFAQMELTISADDGLEVTVSNTGVALESIEGEFESDAVRTLVGSFASLLGDAVHGGVQEMMQRLIRERMPDLIESGLRSVQDAIATVPLELDPGIGDPISLVLETVPTAADVRRRSALRMSFDAEVTGEGIRPREGDRGIARLSDPEAPDGWGEGIGASLRLETLNALLHEVWRTGALALSPEIPENYAGLISHLSLDARLPPVIAPAPVSSEYPLILQIGGLHLATTPVDGEGVDDYVIALEVGVGIQANGTQLSLLLSQMPVAESHLFAENSGSALLPEVFSGVLETIIWPLIEGFIADSTALAFDEVALDAESLRRYAPRLESVIVVPHFEDARDVIEGRLSLEGALEVRVTVGAP